ncbi:hypothetical protein IWX49DRAFT_583429 [Phyllosticta citricarpa]
MPLMGRIKNMSLNRLERLVRGLIGRRRLTTMRCLLSTSQPALRKSEMHSPAPCVCVCVCVLRPLCTQPTAPTCHKDSTDAPATRGVSFRVVERSGDFRDDYDGINTDPGAARWLRVVKHSTTAAGQCQKIRHLTAARLLRSSRASFSRTDHGLIKVAEFDDFEKGLEQVLGGSWPRCVFNSAQLHAPKVGQALLATCNGCVVLRRLLDARPTTSSAVFSTCLLKSLFPLWLCLSYRNSWPRR